MVTSLPTPTVGTRLLPIPLILPDYTATKARSLIRETRARILPVVESEKTMKYLGILRRRSLLLVSSTRSDILVKDLVEDSRVELDPSTPLDRAVKAMLAADEPYAPVISGNRRLHGVFGYEKAVEYMLEINAKPLNLPVEEFMTSRGLITVTPDEPVYRAWQLMVANNLPALPVVNSKGVLVGVIAEYDLLTRGYTRPELEVGTARRGPRVREAMSTPPVAVEPSTPLRVAAELIAERGIGRVYVIDPESKRLVGVVDRGDIARAWAEG